MQYMIFITERLLSVDDQCVEVWTRIDSATEVSMQVPR
jgi:hypothetical protein